MNAASRQVLQLLRCYRGTRPQKTAATPATMREYEFTGTSPEVALPKKNRGETPARDFRWSQEIPPLSKNWARRRMGDKRFGKTCSYEHRIVLRLNLRMAEQEAAVSSMHVSDGPGTLTIKAVPGALSLPCKPFWAWHARYGSSAIQSRRRSRAIPTSARPNR